MGRDAAVSGRLATDLTDWLPMPMPKITGGSAEAENASIQDQSFAVCQGLEYSPLFGPPDEGVQPVPWMHRLGETHRHMAESSSLPATERLEERAACDAKGAQAIEDRPFKTIGAGPAGLRAVRMTVAREPVDQ